MSESGVEYPESGMDTGTDAGTPGERPATVAEGVEDGTVDPAVIEAVADDAPLGTGSGGPQDDGLAPPFHEPEA